MVCGEFRDVCVFFNAEVVFRHGRQAAFSLNTPDHFITRDLFPFSQILNMPGIPELLAIVSHCISMTERSVAVSHGMASCSCNCLTWVSFSSGTGQRRERLLNLIVGGIRVLVCQRLQDFHIACFCRVSVGLPQRLANQ